MKLIATNKTLSIIQCIQIRGSANLKEVLSDTGLTQYDFYSRLVTLRELGIVKKGRGEDKVSKYLMTDTGNILMEVGL